MISADMKLRLAEAYGKSSKERDGSELQDWKAYERFSFLQRLLHTEKFSLLEIGAGPGKDSFFFKEAGLDVWATDLSEGMIERCKEKGLKAEVMSFDALTFEEETFDSVWALNCLLHVPKENLPHVLEGIKRIMKPGGLFYMGVYGGIDHEGVWENDFHSPQRFFSFYRDHDLEKILTKYFSLEAFHKIPTETDDDGPTHFQGWTLKK